MRSLIEYIKVIAIYHALTYAFAYAIIYMKGVIDMTSINATSARKNLYQLISDVNNHNTPVTITNSRGKNAVLLSEDDWNAIQETIYLNSVPGMVESITQADNEPLSERTVYDPKEEW